MAPSLVQSKAGFIGSGTLTGGATLDAPATAGNLLVLCIAGDKNSTSFTWSGATIPVALFSSSVSLMIGFKEAAGGETAVQATLGVNAGGCNTYAAELSESGAGAWEQKATAGLNGSDGTTTVTGLSSGTTGTLTGEGWAFAAFSSDSVGTAGTAAYTNSFVARQGQGDSAGTAAGLWVASAVITSGTAETTLSRSGTPTADQMSGGIIVVGRAVGAGPPSGRLLIAA